MILNKRRGWTLTWTLTCNHVSKEREVRWEKQKQKSPTHLETHERQSRVCTYQTDLPRRVNHLTGKNTDWLSFSELFLSLLRSSLSVAPVALFRPCFPPPFSLERNRKCCLLISLTRVTPKAVSGLYLSWAWGEVQRSRICSWLEWEARPDSTKYTHNWDLTKVPRVA